MPNIAASSHATTFAPASVPSRHTGEDSSPVMVIGHGSSGTSLMVGLLRKYFDIAIGTESQFIMRYYRRLDRYGDLSSTRNLRRLVRHILNERWFERCKRFGFETNVEDICQRIQQKSYAGVLNAVFSEFAEQVGCRRWGDKTPEYIHDLDVLHELFSEAKYIYVVRDGRDVALSLMNRHFGANNVFLAAHHWRSAVEKGDAFADRLDRSKLMAIKYEDLLSEPAGTLENVARFLGVNDRSGEVISRIRDCVSSDVQSTNFDKWKMQMSEEQVRQFEEIACERLIHHGYETNVRTQRPEPHLLETAWWRVDDRVRRLVSKKYWFDNAYKAKLRLQTLVNQFDWT